MTTVNVQLTARQVDVLRALAFLNERRGKGPVRKELQLLVDGALAAAEHDPDVRAALRARYPLSLVKGGREHA